MVVGEPVDDSAGQHVEAAADAVSFPCALPPQQSSLHPTVVRLPPGEIPSAGDVGRLDRSHFGKGDPHERRPFRRHADSVERTLVGAERDEGGGGILGGRVSGVDRDGVVRSEVQLGQSVGGVGQDGPMVGGGAEHHRCPGSGAEGEAELAGLGVKVETALGEANEGSAYVGDPGRRPPTEPTAMGRRETEGDLGRGEADGAGDVEVSGPVASEAGEGAPGGEVFGERLAEALVDEEAELLLELANGQGEWRSLGGSPRRSRRAPSRRVARRRGMGEGEDQGTTGIHDPQFETSASEWIDADGG